MHHIIYKTSSATGKYYIGRHSTNDLDDGYLGSGNWIKSCKKIGKSLKRETIVICNDLASLIDTEERYIKENINHPNCMNMTDSALGGFLPGKHNICHDPVIKKKRSQNSYWKTDEGRKRASEFNPSKRPNVKNKRREQIKAQWQDPKTRALWSGDNHWTKKKTEASIQLKQRLLARNQQILTCPHCNIEGKGPGMYTSHFNKCKLNIEVL